MNYLKAFGFFARQWAAKYIAPNWKEAALKHYSTIALYTLSALILVPEILFHMLGIDLNPYVLTRWLIGAALFGLVGKFIVQTERFKWTRRAIIGFVVLISLALSIPALAQAKTAAETREAITADLVIRWEGRHMEGRYHVSYTDIVGVCTYCFGETQNCRLGLRFTESYCRARLEYRLEEYRDGLHLYFTDETIQNRLPPRRDAAFTSLAYNVGIRAAGRSTATRRINRGNIAGACEALTWWNKAGGRVVRGLVNRRRAERDYCRAGLI